MGGPVMAEENIPEGKPKPKKKISIVRIVLLLLVIIGIILLKAIPSHNPNVKINAANSDARSNLHNLYLGCKVYWATQGNDKECTISIASQPDHGFVKSEHVSLEGHGTESTFTATAQHQDSTTRYTMEANGYIEEKK